MIKFAAFLAAAVIATPALAETIQFERDGIRYVADVTTADGVQHITGRQLNGARQPFDLRVRKGYVTGTIGYAPVAYAVPAAKPVATAAVN